MASTYIALPVTSSSSSFTAGGDLTGTSSSQTVVSLTGSAGVVTGPTTGLKLGSTPAATGLLRLASATAINYRNAANSADLNLISTNASNNVTVGNSTGDTTITAGGSLIQTSTNNAFFTASTGIYLGASSVILRTSGSAVVGTWTMNATGAAPLTLAVGTTFSIVQADNATNSATGATMSVLAQNATGTTATGGDLRIGGGTGTTANGVVDIRNPITTTSAPSAGGAGALPATPTGYLTIKVGGTSRQIAYY